MSTIQKKEQNKTNKVSIVLGDEPTQVRCPYCNCDTLTIVDFCNGYNTYILSLIVLLIFGILISLFLIPVVFVVTKTLVHKCQHCENEIGTNGKLIYGLNLKDDIISLKVGEIGCILTKKILSGIFLSIIAGAILYYQIYYGSTNSYNHTHSHDNIVYINSTWPQFLDICKREQIFKSLQSYEQCKNAYLEKSFKSWEGYVIRIEDYRYSVKRYQHHAISILVKMDPSEYESHADLLLTLDTDMVEHMNDILDSLERGNQIFFNATLKSLGSDHQTRHLHGINIIKGNNHTEIPPHIHNNGRYSDKPRLIRGKKHPSE